MVKTVIIALLALAVGAVAGGYGGYSIARFTLGSHWLREQAEDVEDRVQLLRHLRGDEVAQTIETMEKAVDADLISMVVDRFISETTVSRINEMLEVTREYRARYPRTTGIAFIDDNVAARLSGDLTD